MKDDAPLRDPVAAVALLGEPNRYRLYQHVVSKREPVGRDDAAAALDISRELAAFHLDRLVAGGLLEAEYRRRSGRGGPGAGRPAKLYRRTEGEVAVSFPPRHYDRAGAVFAGALGGLEGTSGIEAVTDVARRLGNEVGVEVRRNAGPRSSRRRRLTSLLDLLRGAGYEPEVEKANGVVYLRNCPYNSLALSHRDVTCGMNVAWAEGVVAAMNDAKLNVEFAPMPDRCCVVLRNAQRGTQGGPAPDDTGPPVNS